MSNPYRDFCDDFDSDYERMPTPRDVFEAWKAATSASDARYQARIKQLEEALQWQPIETAPKDNKRPLLLASFNDDGSLQDIDTNGSWESDIESWEMPQQYFYWSSDYGRVEEPSHWMYQPEFLVSNKALSTTSPDTALQRKVLEARVDELETARDGTHLERRSELRAQLAALGE